MGKRAANSRSKSSRSQSSHSRPSNKKRAQIPPTNNLIGLAPLPELDLYPGLTKKIKKTLKKAPSQLLSSSILDPSEENQGSHPRLSRRVKKIPIELSSKSFILLAPHTDLIKRLLLDLRSHPSSYLLNLPQSQMDYIPDKLSIVSSYHITLNEAIQKVNIGQYESYGAFFSDLSWMFQKHLQCLRKGKHQRKGMEKLDAVYVEYLEENDLDNQIDEYLMYEEEGEGKEVGGMKMEIEKKEDERYEGMIEIGVERQREKKDKKKKKSKSKSKNKNILLKKQQEEEQKEIDILNNERILSDYCLSQVQKIQDSHEIQNNKNSSQKQIKDFYRLGVHYGQGYQHQLLEFDDHMGEECVKQRYSLRGMNDDCEKKEKSRDMEGEIERRQSKLTLCSGVINIAIYGLSGSASTHSSHYPSTSLPSSVIIPQPQRLQSHLPTRHPLNNPSFVNKEKNQLTLREKFRKIAEDSGQNRLDRKLYQESEEGMIEILPDPSEEEE